MSPALGGWLFFHAGMNYALAAPKFKFYRRACPVEPIEGYHDTTFFVGHTRQAQAHFDPAERSHQHEIVEVS